MCGINGIFYPAGSRSHDASALIDRMNVAIAHRGPDDSGIWCDRDAGIYLGHRRLSIIDLSERGHQPMIAPAGHVIAYNGEAYNFQELRRDLKHINFQSGTDTEVVLHLCVRFGPEALQRITGMFAFAVWDPVSRRLMLARDRMGIKPLYYATVNGIFAFSSEVKALLTLPWIRAQIDERALYDFLTYNSVAAPRSIFQGIRKVRPGCYLTVEESGALAETRYWQIAFDDSLLAVDESEIRSRLLCELGASVDRHRVSDVPIGAFLSGGVDSSAITALLARTNRKPINTYSIGFANAPGYDERSHASRVATLLGTNHYEKVVTAAEFTDSLPKMVEIFDEPLADSTSIPLYFLSQQARASGTPVVFTGDGSDEIFCGYRSWRRYVDLYPYYAAFLRLPRVIRRAAAVTANMFQKGAAIAEILARAAKGQELFWGGAAGLKEAAKQSFLSPEFARRMDGYSSYAVIERFRAEFEEQQRAARRAVDQIDWMCFLGLKFVVPETYLYRADYTSMAHGIEARVPFLDHNVVEMAFAIPGKFKLREGEPKSILKKALEAILPRDVLYRRKMGFNVPLGPWAKDIMIDYLEQNYQGFCATTGLFNSAEFRRVVAATKSGDARYVSALWNCYFLMNWFRHWLKA